jgi:CRISPR-associated protein Cas5d
MIDVVFEGDYACFTNPIANVERFSYPFINPSAAVGLLKSVFWKPEMDYIINEIQVLKPIKYVQIKTNEIKEQATNKTISIQKFRTQRNNSVLKDVSYRIKASIKLTEKGLINSDNTIEKYFAQFCRRIDKGGFKYSPYFGQSSFLANFRRPNKNDIPIQQNRTFDNMVKEKVYDENGCKKNLILFDAKMRNGVIVIE